MPSLLFVIILVFLLGFTFHWLGIWCQAFDLSWHVQVRWKVFFMSNQSKVPVPHSYWGGDGKHFIRAVGCISKSAGPNLDGANTQATCCRLCLHKTHANDAKLWRSERAPHTPAWPVIYSIHCCLRGRHNWIGLDTVVIPFFTQLYYIKSADPCFIHEMHNEAHAIVSLF